jgi:hypothetical protein
MNLAKIIKLIPVVLLFQNLNLFGVVEFEFLYADKPGSGFHIKPEAKRDLEEVGQMIGSQWLKHHDAKITF